MIRIALLWSVIVFTGCSSEPDANVIGRGTAADLDDGGQIENADRDKTEAFFTAIKKVQSADEEKELFAEFGNWLKANGYKVRVELKNGMHQLSCPYFPPVTPWTSHKMLDITNLELLPQVENAE